MNGLLSHCFVFNSFSIQLEASILQTPYFVLPSSLLLPGFFDDIFFSSSVESFISLIKRILREETFDRLLKMQLLLQFYSVMKKLQIVVVVS